METLIAPRNSMIIELNNVANLNFLQVAILVIVLLSFANCQSTRNFLVENNRCKVNGVVGISL